MLLKWNKNSNINPIGIVNNAYNHSNESRVVRSPVAVDLNTSDDEIKNIRILWIRNIKRIQIQVINNFPVY